jgi:hypothetical protein
MLQNRVARTFSPWRLLNREGTSRWQLVRPELQWLARPWRIGLVRHLETMDSSVVPSLITAGAALAVAIASGAYARSTSKGLENLKSALEEKRSAKAARTEYEYEARKRLYAECEPVLFQAAEFAEDASFVS